MSNERDAVLLAGEIHEELRKCRAQLEAVTRERDEAHVLWDDALRQVLRHSNARRRAEADAARLREALMQVRDAMLATGQGPDGDDDPRRPVATVVWRALASTPSAELTPRDMRVAEAVREACVNAFCVPFWEQRTPEATLRAIDLRAIVAKVASS